MNRYIVVYYDQAADAIGIEGSTAKTRAEAAAQFEDGGTDRLHVTAYTLAEWDQVLVHARRGARQ